MTNDLTLHEMIADFERDFDLDHEDHKFVMFADAKDKLRPLFDVLRSRLAEVEEENEALRRELQRYRDRRQPVPRTEQ